MSLKKILSLSLGLVILAAVAILISTGIVGAQSLRLNPLVAAPPPPSVPVSVVNTHNRRKSNDNPSKRFEGLFLTPKTCVRTGGPFKPLLP